jgi:hypothetical protein
MPMLLQSYQNSRRFILLGFAQHAVAGSPASNLHPSFAAATSHTYT